MSLHTALAGHKVAVSISESADMPRLGFGAEHLVDAMTEIARHLLALGAGLMYGGDLRPGGFTEILAELSARHRRSNISNSDVTVENFLAWPVHAAFCAKRLEKQIAEFERSAARLVLLSLDGDAMSLTDRRYTKAVSASQREWRHGLTSMRRVMNSVSFARIVLGGRVAGYRGQLPGIAEESLIALDSGRPLFVIGGFGGCAGEVASMLGLSARAPTSERTWRGRELFSKFDCSNLNNGLNESENRRLAATAHIDESAMLIMRGLLRLANRR